MNIYDNILYFTLKNPNFNDRGIYSYDLSKIKFNIPLQFKEPQIKSFNNSGLFYSKNDNSNNFYDKHKIALKRDIKKLYVDGIVDRDTVEYPQSSLSDLFRSINKALLREDYNYIKSYLLMYNKYDYPNENDWIQKQITTENEEWRKESLLFFNQLLEGKYFISKRFTDDSIIISSKNTEVFLKKIENNWYMGLTIINYN